MDRTNFAGLTRLDIGEALSTDNFSFQHLNPKIIDYLLLLGAKAHKHDAHAGLANPTIEPVVSTNATGGTIPADVALYVGYTLLDAQGGETELVQPPVVVTTPAGLSAPTTAPTVALNTTAGTLLSGDRQYGITVTDGAGGETPIGPLAPITVPPGFANAEIQVSGLLAILSATAPGVTGAKWRLYVMIDGQNYQFLNEGSTDTFTDDGSVPVQCINPPDVGTTQSAYEVVITVPGGQDASAVSANVYLSTDGSFDAPCLLANIAAANFGTAYTYGSLSFQAEQPPPVNLSIGGANQINPDTDMLNFPFKRPVATTGALPTVGNSDGDIREVLADHSLHAWSAGASAWVLVSGAGGPPIMSIGDFVTWNDPVFYALTGYSAVQLTGEAGQTDDDQVFGDAFAGISSGTFTGEYTELPAGSDIEVVAAGVQGVTGYAGSTWAASRTGMTANGRRGATAQADWKLNAAGWGWVGTKLSDADNFKGIMARITEAGRLQLRYYLGTNNPPVETDWTTMTDIALTTGVTFGHTTRIRLMHIPGYFQVQVLDMNTFAQLGITDWIAMPSAVNTAWGFAPSLHAAILGNQTTYAEATATGLALYNAHYDMTLNVQFTDPGGNGAGYTIVPDPNAPQPWVALTLDTGWAAGGQTPRYRKEQGGDVIRLDGIVSGAVSGSGNPIATIAPAIALAADRSFVVAGNDATAVVVVTTAGVIYLKAGSGSTYLDLAGIEIPLS